MKPIRDSKVLLETLSVTLGFLYPFTLGLGVSPAGCPVALKGGVA